MVGLRQWLMVTSGYRKVGNVESGPSTTKLDLCVPYGLDCEGWLLQSLRSDTCKRNDGVGEVHSVLSN